MKKILSILFATVLIFTFAFILNSCDGDGADIQGTDIKSTLLTVEDETLTATLSNATESFSFIKDIEVAENAEYIVSDDISCDTVMTSKTVPLEPGDNTYYILVTNGNEQQLYTVTIRRLPMYTVTFNSNGGTPVDIQTVEEGSLATKPTTSREGYNFLSWDYDFTKPITSNTEISARWAPNSGTAYKVEYYLEKVTEQFKFDLVHTDIFAGEAGSTVTAEIKNYEHFTYSSSRSKSSGEIAGDGSLTLKLYYYRNEYSVQLSIPTTMGKITSGWHTQYKPYDSEITVSAAPFPGYKISGWFSDSDKLSSEASYTFKVSGNLNLSVEFEPISEMEGYTFYSTETSCTLEMINDKTVSEVVVPNCVTEIGSGAFEDCLNLESITIPNSVTTIGSSAFAGCISLESIIIPNSVTDISRSIFRNCTSLKNVTLFNNINKIPDSMFEGCSSLESIVIPNGVTEIEAFAFKKCKKLTQITIPDSVTSIGLSAFYDCSELTSVKLPNNITEIADSMFDGCSKLSSITIPEKVMSIGSWAFADCTSLNSITIPDNVKKIEFCAFHNCTNLTSITLINKSGWTVNGNSISSSELEDKSATANYFKNTYYSYEWTRS